MKSFKEIYESKELDDSEEEIDAHLEVDIEDIPKPQWDDIKKSLEDKIEGYKSKRNKMTYRIRTLQSILRDNQ